MQNSFHNYLNKIQYNISTSASHNTHNNLHSLHLPLVDSLSNKVEDNSVRINSGMNIVEQSLEVTENTLVCTPGSKRKNIAELITSNWPRKRHCPNVYSNHLRGSTSAISNDDITEQATHPPIQLAPSSIPSITHDPPLQEGCSDRWDIKGEDEKDPYGDSVRVIVQGELAISLCKPYISPCKSYRIQQPGMMQ